MPGSTNSLAMVQQELYEAVRVNLHVLKAYLTDRVGLRADRVIELADFFQANVRRGVLRPPERERDVQHAVELLLIGRGLQKGTDYDREVGRAKVSSKEVIPDFVLVPLKLAVEVKLLKEASAVARVIDEINADILGYGKAYESIVFVVYDLGGTIRDEVEFRRDLEASQGVRVVLIKH
jgi:REase_DpnII-MboI